MHQSLSLPIVVLIGLAATAAAGQTTSPEYKLGGGAGGAAQWQQAAAPEPGTDAAIIADARRAIAEERPGAAITILDKWIEANKRGSSPLLSQAYLLRGDATTANGDEFEALYDYEAVIKNFVSSPEYVTAVERELEIAIQYVNGLDRRLFGFRWIGVSDIGEELLIRVQERLPGSKTAERAGIELADHYYRSREMELAGIAYELFLKNYPQSQYRAKALQRRIYSSIARFKGPKYDGKPLVDAAVLIKQFQNQFPAQAAESGLDEALLTRIDESGGQQMLESAKWYMKTGDPVSARYTLQRLLTKHPQTTAAAESTELMIAKGWPLTTPRPPTPPPVLERKPVRGVKPGDKPPASAKPDAGPAPKADDKPGVPGSKRP